MKPLPKGIKVLCKYLPEYFERILGYKEYRDAIAATKGDATQLRNVFWNVLGDDYWWEFIKGEIVLRCGLKMGEAQVLQNLQSYLRALKYRKGDGEVYSSRTVSHFPENDFSPSMMYFRKEVVATFTDDMNRFPIPDFILEVNNEDTEENNRGVKFEDYERNGVREYLMMDVDKQLVEQYVLEKGTFDFKGRYSKGILKSSVINDFSIDIETLFNEEKMNDLVFSLYRENKN